MKNLIRILTLVIVCIIYSNSYSQKDTEFINKAAQYSQAGDLKSAIIYLTKAIEVEPNFPDTYYNRAQCYFELKQYENAIKDFSKSISVDPKYKLVAENYRNIGSCNMFLKKYSEAIPYFVKFLEYKPNTPEIIYVLAVCYKNADDNENAIKYYSKSIDNNYRTDYSYYYRGYIYYDLKMYDEAYSDFQKAIKLNSDLEDRQLMSIMESLYAYIKTRK